ncbi:hypothetical protein [Arenimonas composti]|uniref:Uncharacterized protein n=1 Tax=Arenimonas composti TR7-09 = DSM 18010 TaxID=1121013 RepID=A0A091BXV8_9GAMM|nr:hypothetical protein [Arenimonas composti]KFN49190.1 hypothetical protein P873_12095 [Arenimonas composti TR7-09 = DSM 18010]
MKTSVMAGLVLAAASACTAVAAQEDVTNHSEEAIAAAADPIAEVAAETIAEPSAEPVTEPIAEPVTESIAEPVPDTAAVAATAPAPPPPEPVFSNPARQFQVQLGRYFTREERVALLPTVQIQWALRNKVTATGGVFRKHRSSKEVFAPIDSDVLQRVLVQLQDDLAARFQAAGWGAQTAADFAGSLPDVRRLANDRELGVPTMRVKLGDYDQDWAVLSVPGVQPVDSRAIGNGMAWNRWLKGKAGINLSVTYSFAAGTVGETNSRMLGTEAAGGLWFSARADLIGASTGAWGNINVVPEGLVVADDVGTLSEIAGSRASTAENVIRFIGGMGGSDRQGYTIEPDWARVETEMLRAGRAFNAELVARLAAGAGTGGSR